MKILKRLIFSAVFISSNFVLFAQSQSFGEKGFANSPDGVKLFLETEKVNFPNESNSFTAQIGNREDILFYGVNENFASGVLPFQKIKTVSHDLTKNSWKENLLRLQISEDETTYKKKSSFWSSDLIYFAAGVVAATAAYFLISGTSAATSSQKTFGYPPPPSN